MNSYSTTEGTRYTRPQIETRIRKAKQATVDKQSQEHGLHSALIGFGLSLAFIAFIFIAAWLIASD